MYDKIRVRVGGDPKGGWLVDLHDGDNNTVHSPDCASESAAVTAALASHREAFPGSPKETDYVANEASEEAAIAAERQAFADAEAAELAAKQARLHASESAAPAASDANAQPADSSQA